MKKLTIIILSLFFISSSYCNDSIRYRAVIQCNLDSIFYSCKKSDFLKLLDTMNRSSRNNILVTKIEINICKNYIEFKTHKNSFFYKILQANDSLIIFESKKKKLANEVSVCNRERFEYRLNIDIAKKLINLYYEISLYKSDMSLYLRKDMLVFVGKLISSG